MIFSVLTLSLLSRILRKKIVVKSSLPISSSKFLGRIKSARKITKQFVFFSPSNYNSNHSGPSSIHSRFKGLLKLSQSVLTLFLRIFFKSVNADLSYLSSISFFVTFFLLKLTPHSTHFLLLIAWPSLLQVGQDLKA